MQKNLIMATFDDDENIITAAFDDGSTVELYVPDMEDALETTIATRSHLTLLLEDNVLEYTKLMLSGEMQQHLDSVAKSYGEQKRAIKESLLQSCDEATAEYLSREFMMYDD